MSEFILLSETASWDDDITNLYASASSQETRLGDIEASGALGEFGYWAASGSGIVYTSDVSVSGGINTDGVGNFGSDIDDEHAFTGSVNITGSLIVNELEVRQPIAKVGIAAPFRAVFNPVLNLNTSTPLAIQWSETVLTSSAYVHNISTQPTRIYFTVTGLFSVSFHIEHEAVSSNRSPSCYLRTNGTTDVPYTRATNPGNNTVSTLVTFTSGSYVEVMHVQESTSGTVLTFASSSFIDLQLIQVEE